MRWWLGLVVALAGAVWADHGGGWLAMWLSLLGAIICLSALWEERG